MKRLIIATMATLLLGACGNGLQWQTTNITHVMPDLQFTLTRGNGNVVDAASFRGKVTLLYFGYTHCPDVCPLTLATIGRALRTLPHAQQKVIRVLFVSVDPKRDTPALLAKYAASFGPDFIGLTGTQPQLRALAKRYRVSYSYGKPDANGAYVVNHSSAIYAFDGQGHVRLLMKRSDGTSKLAHDLAQLVSLSS